LKPYPHYKASGVPWLGDVPAHWVKQRMAYAFAIGSGTTPPTGEQHWYEGDIPWVQTGELREGVIVGTEKCVSTQAVQAFSALRLHKEGDAVVAMYGATIGRVGLLGVDAAVNQACCVLSPKGGVLSRFVFWWFQSMRDVLVRMASGGGQPNINQEKIAQLWFFAPPLGEQEAIREHLDAETARVDALIAEKERLMETLRELRQAVIVELSTGLHFPVGATRNPSSCIYGFTPAGWTRVRLGKMVRIRNGSTPLKENADYWVGGDFPWLNSSVVNGDTVEGASAFVTRTALRQCHLPIAAPGAVLVALTGQGKTRGMAALLKIEATISQHLACITCDPERLNSEYLFWLLTGQYPALRVVSDGQGGTKGALTCEELGRFEILLPPLAVQAEIAKQLREQTQRIDELQEHAKAEITLLQELRAATITEAVLGRVQVAGSAVAA